MHSVGFLLATAIALQLITGLLLAMQYFPDFALGYTSVRTLTLDTTLGYLMQSLHANNASLVMLMLYVHMLRTLHYSHTSHRLATIGFTLAILLTATCFTGYTLASCQMSYWAAAVILRMLSVLPTFGNTLADYVLAGPSPNSLTLRRFLTAHTLLPFLVTALLLAHVLDLHTVSSAGDSTLRLDVPRTSEVEFHRFVLARDALALTAYATALLLATLVLPELLLHPDT